MSKKSSLIRAGAVLAVALSAGHLVQTMNQKAAPEARIPDSHAGEPAHSSTAEVTKLEKVSAGPEAVVLPVQAAATPEVVELAGSGSDPSELAAPLNAAPAALADAPSPAALADGGAAQQDCKRSLSLAAEAGQMIVVSLSAPCDAGARVVMRHAGLSFAERLDDTGQLMLALPALEVAAEVSAVFADSTNTSASIAMPGVERLKRFAVQWHGDDRFQLHAMENGAEYGEPGHVWAMSPLSENGGRFFTLGDPLLDLPMMAEVYTWAEDGKTRARPVIEAEVTALTCGRDMLGETLLSANGKVVIRDLTLSMPDCDAAGDILVLNNLVPDVTLVTAN